MDSQEKALEQEQNVEQNVTEVEATAPVEQPEETQEAVVVSENSENSENSDFILPSVRHV